MRMPAPPPLPPTPPPTAAPPADAVVATAGDARFTVAVRVRPLLPGECARGAASVVDVHPATGVVALGDPGHFASNVLRQRRLVRERAFAFDAVYGPESTTAEVYAGTAGRLVAPLLAGLNVTVFTYGSTGSGKTHTLAGAGSGAGGGDPGVMGLCLRDLCAAAAAAAESSSGGGPGSSVRLSLSYIEIYCEAIRDLLAPPAAQPAFNAGGGGAARAPLQPPSLYGQPLLPPPQSLPPPPPSLDLREDALRGPCVVGVTEHAVTSVEQALRLVAEGNRRRTQEATAANATSSRSHAILQVLVEQTVHVPSGGDSGRHQQQHQQQQRHVRLSKLSLVDLAGSERASATQNRGLRLQEGANINRSLLSLGNCINALLALGDGGSSRRAADDGDGGKMTPPLIAPHTHVPYRDSKLTRLLKDSLGGPATRTLMLGCVSPSEAAFEETLNSLKWCDRAKRLRVVMPPPAVPPPLVVAAGGGIGAAAALAGTRGRGGRHGQQPLPAPQQPPAVSAAVIDGYERTIAGLHAEVAALRQQLERRDATASLVSPRVAASVFAAAPAVLAPLARLPQSPACVASGSLAPVSGSSFSSPAGAFAVPAYPPLPPVRAPAPAACVDGEATPFTVPPPPPPLPSSSSDPTCESDVDGCGVPAVLPSSSTAGDAGGVVSWVNALSPTSPVPAGLLLPSPPPAASASAQRRLQPPDARDVAIAALQAQLAARDEAVRGLLARLEVGGPRLLDVHTVATALLGAGAGVAVISAGTVDATAAPAIPAGAAPTASAAASALNTTAALIPSVQELMDAMMVVGAGTAAGDDAGSGVGSNGVLSSRRGSGASALSSVAAAAAGSGAASVASGGRGSDEVAGGVLAPPPIAATAALDPRLRESVGLGYAAPAPAPRPQPSAAAAALAPSQPPLPFTAAIAAAPAAAPLRPLPQQRAQVLSRPTPVGAAARAAPPSLTSQPLRPGSRAGGSASAATIAQPSPRQQQHLQQRAPGNGVHVARPGAGPQHRSVAGTRRR